jgi:hypothetical protein
MRLYIILEYGPLGVNIVGACEEAVTLHKLVKKLCEEDPFRKALRLQANSSRLRLNQFIGSDSTDSQNQSRF